MPQLAPVGRVTFGRIGSTYTLDAIRLTETYHRGGTVLRLHDHEDLTINVLIEGTVEERVGRRVYACGTGTFLSKPPGQHHANRYFDRTVRCIVIQLGTGFAGYEWSSRLAMERVFFRQGEAIHRAALRLARVLHEPQIPDNDFVVLTETRRLLSLCESGRRPTVPHRWLAQARDVLADTAAAPKELRQLAASIGVPLWVLSRAFERTYGVSPSQYRRRMRLEGVARQLAGTSVPISTLAHRAGFADHSHLVRWFRRAYGCTPTEYRLRHRKSVLVSDS